MLTSIRVTARVPGFHYWPGAPAPREYLGQQHRHLFVFRLNMQVFTNDREVEFHDLADQLLETARSLDVVERDAPPVKTINFGGRSCEQIGREILLVMGRRYRDRQMVIEVSEDDEFSAFVTLD